MRVKIITVGGFIARLFDDDKGWDWHAMTLPIPWYGVVVVLWGKQEQEKIDHEVHGHVPQVKRYWAKYGPLLGSLLFKLHFAWQYLRYGYENAPLEREAVALAKIEAMTPKALDVVKPCPQCGGTTCWHREFAERMGVKR